MIFSGHHQQKHAKKNKKKSKANNTKKSTHNPQFPQILEHFTPFLFFLVYILFLPNFIQQKHTHPDRRVFRRAFVGVKNSSPLATNPKGWMEGRKEFQESPPHLDPSFPLERPWTPKKISVKSPNKNKKNNSQIFFHRKIFLLIKKPTFLCLWYRYGPVTVTTRMILHV